MTKAGVYAALAYYWDHRDDLDRQWAEAEAFAEKYKRTNPGLLEDLGVGCQ